MAKWALIILLVCCSFKGRSQIIKVNSDRTGIDSTAWQGVFDLSLDNVKNTETIFQLTGASQIAYAWRKNVLMSVNSLRLMFANKVPLENAGHQHFRYIRTINPNIAVEGFTQIQFDQLLKIRRRFVAGAGPRFTLINQEWGGLDFRPGYMYEHEVEDSTDIINSNHRLSNYVTLKVDKSDKVKFFATLFYQPRIDKFSDFRLSPAFALELKVSKNLVYTFAGDLRYDSRPVAGVNNFTYTLTQGLGFRF